MIERPKVSVLMTSFDREKYIAEAIESVLASTYTNFELIIVDDCSTDKTVEIARSYEAKDDRVKVYVNEKNLGDYPNRNRAASFAKGEFIMFVDSDDRILEQGIEKCLGALNCFPESSFGLQYPHNKVSSLVMNSAEAIQRNFFEKLFLDIGPGGTIIRRSFFEKIGGYPITYGPANDMYFNLKVASQSPIVLLTFDFMFYRIHENQEFNNRYGYMFNNYRYLEDALRDLPLQLSLQQKKWLSGKNKRRFAVNIMKYFLSTFDFPKTMNAIRKAKFTFADAISGLLFFQKIP